MHHPLDVSVFDFISQVNANPAAAAQTVLGDSGASRMLLVGCQFTLTTDANAANRIVGLVWNDPVGEILRLDVPVVQTASLAHDYTFAVGIGDAYVAAISLKRVTPLPSQMYFGGTGFISTFITNVQAGDQLSNIVFSYLRWDSSI